MQTNPILRKELVCGIVILILEMNVIPIVGSLPLEKHAFQTSSAEKLNVMKETGPWDVNWTINGTMGNNGWYISPITFTCTYDHDYIAGVYYSVGEEGGWYTGPFTVDTQGSVDFYWYYVDYQGNASPIHGPYSFRIDYTPPTITLTATPLNWLKTKWLFNLTVSDNTSGVAKVEIYVDDVLVVNLTTYPYIFNYQGHGKSIYAIVYDFASNNASSSKITMPLVYGLPHFRFFEWLFERFLYAFPILRYLLGFTP